jgi:hypothetical protein
MPPQADRHGEDRTEWRLGLWSSRLAGALSAGLVVALGLPVAAGAWAPGVFPPVSGLMPAMALNLLLPFAVLLVAAGASGVAVPERRAWSLVAVALASVAIAVDSTAFFVQLAVVIPGEIAGDPGPYRAHLFRPGSVAWATEFFGSTMLTLTAGALAVVIPRTTRMDRITRGLLFCAAATAPILVLGAIVPFVWWFVAAPLWALSFPAGFFCLAGRFREAGRALEAAAVLEPEPETR